MAFWRKDEKEGKDSQDPSVFVARKEYPKAIAAYRAQLSAQPNNYVLNHKLADVLCLAGREKEALGDYSAAADGYAREGFLIKSVAILKKMQKLDPGNATIESRLAQLAATGSSSLSIAVTPAAPAASSAGPPGGAEISFDMEAFDDSAPGLDAQPPAEAEEEPPPPTAQRVALTPLFSEFSADELREVVARLRHRSFPAGETLVTEGSPGDSLFVLSEGRVRVTTKGPKNAAVELATLKEGDFFGEVSLLTGKPRTATITSLEDTEVLELTREDLEALEATHPRIREVINDFYQRRVASTIESMVKASKSSQTRRKS